MNTQSTWPRLRAGLFALLFISSWIWQTGHVFFLHDHNDRHSLPLCVAEHDASGDTHLHDQRYEGDDCSVCAFIFAIPELVHIPALPEWPDTPGVQHLPDYCQPVCSTTCDLYPLRGPPAA